MKGEQSTTHQEVRIMTLQMPAAIAAAAEVLVDFDEPKRNLPAKDAKFLPYLLDGSQVGAYSPTLEGQKACRGKPRTKADVDTRTNSCGPFHRLSRSRSQLSKTPVRPLSARAR